VVAVVVGVRVGVGQTPVRLVAGIEFAAMVGAPYVAGARKA